MHLREGLSCLLIIAPLQQTPLLTTAKLNAYICICNYNYIIENEYLETCMLFACVNEKGISKGSFSWDLPTNKAHQRPQFPGEINSHQLLTHSRVVILFWQCLSNKILSWAGQDMCCNVGFNLLQG